MPTAEQIEAADRATGGRIPLVLLLKALVASEGERQNPEGQTLPEDKRIEAAARRSYEYEGDRKGIDYIGWHNEPEHRKQEWRESVAIALAAADEAEPVRSFELDWRGMDSAPRDGTFINAVARYPDATAGFPTYISWQRGGWFEFSRNAPARMIPWAWRPRGGWPAEPVTDAEPFLTEELSRLTASERSHLREVPRGETALLNTNGNAGKSPAISYGYSRLATLFAEDRTAQAFVSEDGEGGFAGAVFRMAREIDRLTRPPESGLREAPTHRHKKRGSAYVLLGYGKMQTDFWEERGEGTIERPAPVESVDMREVAIYRSVDDLSLWVHPREEFEDGRFEIMHRRMGR